MGVVITTPRYRPPAAGRKAPAEGPGDPERHAREAVPLSKTVTPMRILLVDDHEVVREGLRNLLSTHPEIEVAGEAADGASAIRRVGYDSPDVVSTSASPT